MQALWLPESMGGFLIWKLVKSIYWCQRSFVLKYAANYLVTTITFKCILINQLSSAAEEEYLVLGIVQNPRSKLGSSPSSIVFVSSSKLSSVSQRPADSGAFNWDSLWQTNLTWHSFGSWQFCSSSWANLKDLSSLFMSKHPLASSSFPSCIPISTEVSCGIGEGCCIKNNKKRRELEEKR